MTVASQELGSELEQRLSSSRAAIAKANQALDWETPALKILWPQQANYDNDADYRRARNQAVTEAFKRCQQRSSAALRRAEAALGIPGYR